MWTSVLKQMWNCKRSNIWIAMELLLVFCLTWYLVDFLFVICYNYNIPNHRNVENTWQINLGKLNESHPDYSPAANEPEVLEANYTRILQTIHNYPGIESVGISFDGSTPGVSSYYGRGYRSATDTSLIAAGQAITIYPGEDFFKVFRFSTDNGSKMISNRDFEWGANGIILSRSIANILFPNGSAIGQEITTYDMDSRYTVICVLDDNKRFDYLRPQNYFYLSRNLDAGNLKRAELSVRYNSSLPEKKFREQFKSDMTNSLQIGNFYLLSVIPYTKIGEDTAKQFGVNNEINIRIYMILFFLVCIFLCLIGTFWYRVSLRPNEIGLRKAIGASSNNIHYSLIIEGVWLLLIIVLPAMLIEFQFVQAGLIDTVGREREINPEYLPDRTFLRFMITNAITFICILIIIALAIWLPARKGASLVPAEALHCE